MKDSLKLLIALFLAGLLVALLGSFSDKLPTQQLLRGNLPAPSKPQAIAVFAKCLRNKGLKMYGTAWCGSCKKQRELFGEPFKYIPEIDCDKEAALCKSRGIKGYPVWEDAQGNLYPGAKRFERLAEISGCRSPSDLASSGIVDITLLIAFIAGLISFLAPCIIPLIPSYFSTITGFTFKDLYGLQFNKLRPRIFLSTLFFIMGFSVIFSLMGAASSAFGQYINNNLQVLLRISGGFLVVFGLIQLGIINFKSLRFDFAWKVQRKLANLGFLTSAITGVVSALVWIPCIGSVLGSILLLASSLGSTSQGVILLFVYSLGISFPFILLSLFFPTIFIKLQNSRKLLHNLSLAAGAIMVAFGALLLADRYSLFLRLFGI
jgi:cytochrome c-type biogenesis protein